MGDTIMSRPPLFVAETDDLDAPLALNITCFWLNSRFPRCHHPESVPARGACLAFPGPLAPCTNAYSQGDLACHRRFPAILSPLAPNGTARGRTSRSSASA